MKTTASTAPTATDQTSAKWNRFAPFLFEPVFLAGEDPKDYERIRNQIFNSANPQDDIEAVLLGQFVSNFWECLGKKRLKLKYILSSEAQGVNQLLALYGPSDSQEMAMKWMRGEKSAVRYVNSVLKKAGLDREAITAQTVGLFIEKIAAFDRMIAVKESLVAKSLAALHFHREALARRVRQETTHIETLELAGAMGQGKTLAS